MTSLDATDIGPKAPQIAPKPLPGFRRVLAAFFSGRPLDAIWGALNAIGAPGPSLRQPQGSHDLSG